MLQGDHLYPDTQSDTTYLLTWLKLKMLILSRAGKDVEELELEYTADGSVKWYNYIEKNVLQYTLVHSG